MNQQNIYKLPQTVLVQLQKQIDKFKTKEDKLTGFDEVLRYEAIKEITKNQINKIVSFIDNFKPTVPEDKDRKVMYGDKLISYARNQQKSIATKERLSNQIRTSTSFPSPTPKKSQAGRTIDQNKVSKASTLASVNPPEVTYYGKDALSENIARIKKLMF